MSIRGTNVEKNHEKRTGRKLLFLIGAVFILLAVIACAGKEADKEPAGTINFTVTGLKNAKGSVIVSIQDEATFRYHDLISEAGAENGLFGGLLPVELTAADFKLLFSSGFMVSDEKDREYIRSLYKPDSTGNNYVLIPEAGEADVSRLAGIQKKEDALKTIVISEFDGNEVKGEFRNIPYGSYALEAWHDENADGDMTWILGIPAEGWGMTNYSLGQWSFYMFQNSLYEESLDVKISMGYYYDTDPEFTGNVQFSGSRGFPSDIYKTDMNLKEVYFRGKAVNDDFKLDISWLGEPGDLAGCPVVYVTDSYYRRPQYKYIHYLSVLGEIPPVLVVGIGYKEGKSYDSLRNRELINYPDSFLNLIESEIIPLAEKGFSVDPDKRILFGHSNGGRFSLYTLFKQAKSGRRIFSDFIAGSTATYSWDFSRLVPEAGSELPYTLYMSVGTYEDLVFFGGNKDLYELLTANKYKDFTYYYNLHLHRTHFQSSIPALVDGLCLIFSKNGGLIPMLEDLDKTHTRYDFSYPVQAYDWYFSEHFAHSAGRALSPSPDPEKPNGKISCMKLECGFTEEDKKVPVSTGLEASVIPEINLSVDVYVPAGLAGLGYEIELYIVSGAKWLMETSGKQTLKQGWNTYSFDWTEENTNGDLTNVGSIGLWIEKPENAENWSGDIYIDNLEW